MSYYLIYIKVLIFFIKELIKYKHHELGAQTVIHDIANELDGEFPVYKQEIDGTEHVLDYVFVLRQTAFEEEASSSVVSENRVEPESSSQSTNACEPCHTSSNDDKPEQSSHACTRQACTEGEEQTPCQEG